MSDCEFLPDPPEGFRIASDAELTGELPSELQWTHATRGYWSHSRYAGKKFPTGKPRNSFYAVPLSTEPQPSALERRCAELEQELENYRPVAEAKGATKAISQRDAALAQITALSARVAELETERDGLQEDLNGTREWLAQVEHYAGSQMLMSDFQTADQMRAALTESRKDGQRIDAIIANKWTITWNYLRDSFIVQSKDQVCGNIGHSKSLRELIDAAMPLPTMPLPETKEGK